MSKILGRTKVLTTVGSIQNGPRNPPTGLFQSLRDKPSPLNNHLGPKIRGAEALSLENIYKGLENSPTINSIPLM